MPLHWHRVLSPRRRLSVNPFVRNFSISPIMPTPARQLNALDEVVYDSEPERAEIRRRLRKTESKSLSTDSSEDLRPMFKIQNAGRDNDVIEISGLATFLTRCQSI